MMTPNLSQEILKKLSEMLGEDAQEIRAYIGVLQNDLSVQSQVQEVLDQALKELDEQNEKPAAWIPPGYAPAAVAAYIALKKKYKTKMPPMAVLAANVTLATPVLDVVRVEEV